MKTSIFYNIFHRSSRKSGSIIGRKNFTYRNILSVLYSNGIIADNEKLSVLDYGCGVGTLDLYLGKMGNMVDGVDISSKAIQIAKSSAEHLKLSNNCRFFLNGEFDIAQKKQYDLVLCTEVIEHIKDPISTLKVLFSLSKRNAFLFLSTPSLNSPLYKLGLLNSFDKQVGHLRRYNETKLKLQVEKSGYVVKKIIKNEGIIRILLFTQPSLGWIIRFIRGPISDVVTILDNLSLNIFSESDLILIAQKP